MPLTCSSNSFPAASSITHQHLVAVLNTLIERSGRPGHKVRILDLGFGGGLFLSYMLDIFPLLQPGIDFELYGLDVTPWQLAEKKGKGFLCGRHPEVDWQSRLAIIPPNEPWPYTDRFFDFIISNQVMEHVEDHGFVLGEIYRCLHAAGTSINLFPVREVMWEAHAHMPFVHRVTNEAARARVMLFLAAIGFRKCYRADEHHRNWKSMADFSRVFSGVLENQTNYISIRNLIALARCCGLEIEFTYTKDFYTAKFLSWFGKHKYTYLDRGILESAGLFVGKRVASVTVLLRKPAAQV